MNIISQPEVVLRVRRPGGFHMFGTNLTQVNKPELVDCLTGFRRMLRQVEPKFTDDSDPDMIRLAEEFRESGAASIKKDGLMNLVVSIGCEISNIFNVARAVAPAYLEVWQRLIAQSTLSLEEITEILGRRPYVMRLNTWRTLAIYDIMLALADYNIIRESYWDDKNIRYEFWLPQYIRRQAALTLFGTDCLKARTLDKLPEDEGLRMESFEGSMPRVITFLTSLDKATPLLAGGTSAISTTKIKSAAKKLNAEEFTVKDSEFPLSRNHLVILAFMSQLNDIEESKAKGTSVNLKSYARFVINELMQNMPSGGYHLMIPRIKGITRKLCESTRAPIIAEQVRKLIEKANGAWLDMSDFKLRYMCEDNLMLRTAAYTGLFNPGQFIRSSARTDDKCEPYRDAEELDLWQDVTWRFIVSYLRLLEAAGILEIAYGPDDSAPDIDNIRYVRYTELGRYAIGVINEYKPVVDPDLADRFDVDSDNMIITILNDNSPYRNFFGQISDSIGKQRYKFSAAALVRDIHYKDEVAERIQSLRDVVCPDPDGEWKILLAKKGSWATLFGEAQLRANSRLPVKGNYKMIRLNPEVPGLLEFILNTPEIAANTIKAEQSILLVPEKFMDRLHKLANAAGYYL